MFITRGTRHDKDDIRDLLATREWDNADLNEGKSFLARDGKVIGHVRVVEVEPAVVVVDDVMVAEDRRGNGIGTDLMKAAMLAQGGTMYCCCHEDRIAFYERLGFSLLENGFDDAPASAQEYWRKVDDYPTAPDHVHYFLKAR